MIFFFIYTQFLSVLFSGPQSFIKYPESCVLVFMQNVYVILHQQIEVPPDWLVCCILCATS